MNSSNDLFVLLKSLSTSEKRQFTLFASRYGKGSDSNYLRLFDAVMEQEVYDEAALRLRFSGEGFVRNFSVAKAYLYQMVLQSLRLNKAGRSLDMELREALDDIELLHRRGLRGQARKKVRLAIRKARQYEALPYLAELYNWSRRLVNWQDKDAPEQFEQLEQDELATLNQLTDDTHLRSVRAEVSAMFLNQVDLRNPKVADKLERLLSHPLLQSPPDHLAFTARINWFTIHSIHHRMRGDLTAFLQHNQSVLDTWQAAPRQAAAHPALYLNAHITYLDACLRAGRYPEFHAGRERLRAHTFKDPVLQARAFSLGAHLDLRQAITTGDLAGGMAQQHAITQGLEAHRAYLPEGIELTLVYNLCVVHFLAGAYREALVFSNRILNQPTSPVRQDIPEAARLYELLCHLARGNMDLVESLLRSLRRRLRHRPRAFPYEQPVLRAADRILQASHPDHRHQALLDLKNSLEDMEGAAHTIGREEILLWAEGQLLGRPVGEIMRERL